MERARLRLLVPDWPAPKNVFACSTLRGQVLPENEYSWFNLALHVDDDEKRVVKNRSDLCTSLALPSEPVWLNQVHGVESVNLSRLPNDGQIPVADAAYTTQSQQVCTVMTADCLPLLVTDLQGRGIAAIHAGWRGLSQGVIAQTLQDFCRETQVDYNELLVWLGPAISQTHFEVGGEVKAAFKMYLGELPDNIFLPSTSNTDKYLCDLYALARLELAGLGVENVYGGEQCTYAQHEDYFSYRRASHQGFENCGRMATLIWMQ